MNKHKKSKTNKKKAKRNTEIKLKKKDWLFVEEIPRSNPLLLAGWSKSLEYDLKKWYSTKLDNIIAYNGYYAYLFFREKEWHKASQHTFNKTLQNPEWMLSLNKWNKRNQLELIKFTKKMQVNVKKLSTNKLLNLFEKWMYYFNKSMISGWTEMPLDWHYSFFSNYLLSHLKEKLKENKSKYNPQELLTILSIPERKTTAKKEAESMLKIAIEAGKKSKLKKLLLIKEQHNLLENLKKYPKIYSMLGKHAAKFRHMTFMYNGPAVGIDYYVKVLQKTVREKNLKKRLKELQEAPKKLKKEKKLIYRLLGIDSKHKKFFQIASNIQYNKDLRIHSRLLGFYRSDALLKELAKRLGCSLNQIRFVFPWKIKEELQRKKISADELNKRFEGYFLMFYDGKKYFYSGKNALKKLELIIPKFKLEKSAKVIKGNCAFPGKAKGKVKIINTTNDLHHMNEGDILVAVNTDTDLVPAMEKAAAIVTDVGGLTSHAAIISRELKTPCLVGTKFGSKVLKDNDFVIVNATKGLIKKLKEK